LVTAILISTRPQRFSFIRLLGNYLILSRRTFSLTLTTMAFDHSSLRWFEASIHMAAPRDLPSSFVEHGLRLRGAHSLQKGSLKTLYGHYNNDAFQRLILRGLGDTPKAW
jgi:hypothetical protein